MGTEMTVTDWPVAASSGAARSELAEDLEIDGDVTSSGPVDILGKITGSVRAPDVLISANGRVAGRVTALQVSVLGTVDGSIAAQSVSLAGSSRVHADITHETIIIETGAAFEGSLKRKS
jgi:cytoskeletal protein CcmA (bactofilin family)